MDVVSLTLKPRKLTGKKVASLRREGVIPVHLYGGSTSAMSLQVESRLLNRTLVEVGSNRPLSVQIDGADGEDICFVREVQRHAVTDEVMHVDFLRVDVSQAVSAEVPIEYIGEAPGVRNLGGTLIQAMTSIQVEALPMRMPGSITVDISVLEDFEKTIVVGDVGVPNEVTVLSARDGLVARVVPPRVEEEPEPTEDEEMDEVAESAEVEVITKDKGEDEGDTEIKG